MSEGWVVVIDCDDETDADACLAECQDVFFVHSSRIRKVNLDAHPVADPE